MIRNYKAFERVVWPGNTWDILTPKPKPLFTKYTSVFELNLQFNNNVIVELQTNFRLQH